MGSLLRWTFGGEYGFTATMDLWRTVWVHCYDALEVFAHELGKGLVRSVYMF